MRIQYIGSAILLLVILGAANAFSADEPQAMTGAQIVAKHLQAIGGKDAVARITSRVAIGTVKKESEPDAQMAIMSEGPDRVSAMYVFRDYTWQLTYDHGKVIFRPTISKEGSLIEKKYREMLASGALFNNISLYNILAQGESDDVKFEAKGTRKIKNRPSYIVELKQAKMQPLLLYFDSETFMWVRTEYGRVSYSKTMGTFTNDVVQHGEDQQNVDFSFDTWDFKEVDGVKLPFKFEQTVAFPLIKQKSAGTIVGTIKEYRHNIPIDPKMFQ
jgi:hypothetical protein